jgi:hypothetical protein
VASRTSRKSELRARSVASAASMRRRSSTRSRGSAGAGANAPASPHGTVAAMVADLEARAVAEERH